MSVYTVHEPPPRAANASPDPLRFVFVRDGFSLGAFLVTPLWMIWHRQWLVLLWYLVASIAIEVALRALGGSAFVIGLAGALISLLIGLEAATLRRFTLRRRDWRNVGIVSGDRLEDAELRFFASWVRRTPSRDAATAARQDGPPPGPTAVSSDAATVVGLFPEPGVPR